MVGTSSPKASPSSKEYPMQDPYSISNMSNIHRNNSDGDGVDMIDIEEGTASQTLPTLTSASTHIISSSDISGSHNEDAEDHPSPYAVEAVDEPPAAADTSAAQSHTVEIMDDDIDGMPLTNDMAEAISYATEPKEARRIELIDDDDDAPVPPATLQNSLGSDNNAIDIQYVDEQHGPPQQFSIAQYEEDEDLIAKQNANEGTSQRTAGAATVNASDRVPTIDEINESPAEQPAVASDIGPIDDNVPTIEDMERDERQAGIHVGGGLLNTREWDVETPHDDEEGDIVGTNDEMGIPQGDDNATAIHIPEAFLVEEREEAEVFMIEEREEGTVYEATPTLPWWKQRKIRVLLGAVFVIVATLAIALGVTLSSPPETITVDSTPSPSVSMFPTSSPTTCVHKITKNAQQSDLQKDLQIDDPYLPSVAVDGTSMIIVAKDEKYISYNDWGSKQYDGPVFVAFYSLDNVEEKWRRIQTIRLDNMGSWYEVALSGTTAFVGFPYANNDAGTVLVFEQNQFGEWEEMEDPFIHNDNVTQGQFGRTVEVDGDLACVGYEDPDTWDNYMNLYHHEEDGKKRVQFDTVDGRGCSISGDIIAIYDWIITSNITFMDGFTGANSFSQFVQLYKYNQDTKEVTPIQEPIPSKWGIWSLDLSNNYLVYSKDDRDYDENVAFIYKRDDKNQTFTLHQKLNSAVYQYNSLALDNDILVVGGDNHTHIFSLQNDEWAETITLDQAYHDYQFSGRTLIATTEENEVYSFNIQDCMQAMPTQSPTMSLAPSLAPSSHPSLVPTSLQSLVPSLSVPPTFSWQIMPWRQQGLAIAGDTAYDYSGTSVAISGDGKTLVVGSPTDYYDRPGYVKVYYKKLDFTAGWKWQLVETFTDYFDTSVSISEDGTTSVSISVDGTRDGGQLFGRSVSISEDGNTLAAGTIGSDRPGYTRVYTREDDKWAQLGEDIEDEANGDDSGRSVSLSSNGKTIAIGAIGNDGINGEDSGHVRVYTVVEGDGGSNVASWKQVGQDIDGEAECDYSGSTVSLSADGRTVAIGATTNDGGGVNSGHVRVYSLVDDEWEQVGDDIDGENEYDFFGTSVSLSSDGKMVAVGAIGNGDNGEWSGKVQVYMLDSNEKWVRIGQDLIGEAEYDRAGTSVSLSSDGNALAIGAIQSISYGGPGYVRVYRLEGSNDSWSWTQFGEDINGAYAGDTAGSSVALSSDGKVIAVGSPYNNDNGDYSGHVRVFGV